jgi:cation transport regulator
MPYADRDALPESVRRRLPPDAQDIYCRAFNHAWQTYARRPDREAVCHRVAWAAVKRRYERVDGRWALKGILA